MDDYETVLSVEAAPGGLWSSSHPPKSRQDRPTPPNGAPRLTDSDTSLKRDDRRHCTWTPRGQKDCCRQQHYSRLTQNQHKHENLQPQDAKAGIQVSIEITLVWHEYQAL